MGLQFSQLNKTESVLSELNTLYQQDPVKITNLVNLCKKEIIKLNRETKNLIPPSDDEIVQKFNEMDYNGNKIISLAEIDKLISQRYPLFDNKPALMRAYKAADTNKNGFISLKEFKNLWKYIIYYNNLWQKFEKVDFNNDRRIDFKEFKQFSSSLFDTNLTDKEYLYLFDLIDLNNGGKILFNEFCSFMIRRKIALQ